MSLSGVYFEQHKQIMEEFLGIIGQDPCASKSNRSHVVIFRFLFLELEVYSLDSSKTFGHFPEVVNFN
jgi:hypothetical protein